MANPYDDRDRWQNRDDEYRYYSRGGFNSGSSGSSYDPGRERSANQGDYTRRASQNWGNSSDWDEEPVWTYSEYWWIVPGPYSGIGPRQYQRSDERICDDVCERMAQHGQLDASQIDVEVNNGEATLTGTVNSRREKRLAEDIVESVFGVSDVHNQLRISGQSGQQSSQSFGQNRDRQFEQQRSGQTSGQIRDTGMQGRGSAQEDNMQTTLPSGSSLRSRIREGMETVGQQGRHIGQVKEIRQNDFLVDREMARDVYVPFSAIQSTEGRVMLNVRAEDVDNQGWEMSEIMGTSSQGQTGR